MRHRPRLIAALEAAGAFCLTVLMVTVFIDVLGRNLLNRPLPWGTEVLEIVLAAMIFVIYPVLAVGFGHITVDLISVRRSVQRFQRALGSAMGCVLFAVIAWCLGRQTLRSADYGESTALLNVPIAWILGGMTALACVTAGAFLVATVRSARRAPSSFAVRTELV